MWSAKDASTCEYYPLQFWFLKFVSLCGESMLIMCVTVVIKCRTTVFSHSQTVVVCGNCQTVLCQPTGGRARLTEGCSFRRKGDWEMIRSNFPLPTVGWRAVKFSFRGKFKVLHFLLKFHFWGDLPVLNDIALCCICFVMDDGLFLYTVFQSVNSQFSCARL